MSEALHAGCVAIGGRGVLIAGASGRGKSDLALRLVDRGATLVSDDYTILSAEAGRLVGNPPSTIAGRIEVRGVGILDMPIARDVPVCLLADLDAEPQRLPEAAVVRIAGIEVPVIALAALEASAPIKVEQALLRFGLALP